MVRSMLKVTLIVSAILLGSVSAFAHSGELLIFQGVLDNQPIGDFYNGGGLASTPNYGITFSSNFFGLVSVYNGGAGAFSQTPTTTAAIFVNGPTGSPATGVMNVGPGFSGGLNFFYTAGFTSGQTEMVTIWSGTNGTGTVLATITLGNNNGACTGFPAYCTWSNIGATFTGTAHSVTFTGPANELGIADMTVGGSTPAIPEPSPVYLLGTGLAAISLSRMRRVMGL
jgi:hypothetical protein